MTSATHPLHDPTDRALLAPLDKWELRQYAEHDRRLAYFATKGFAHVQLWHPTTSTSIVTPSRLTAGNFDLWCASREVRYVASTWFSIADALFALDIRPPNRHEVRAIERWFVLPGETSAGRLLRSWWAGEAVR